jgi:hypothetical protein
MARLGGFSVARHVIEQVEGACVEQVIDSNERRVHVVKG